VTCPEAADEIIEELNSRKIAAARPIYKPLHFYLCSSGFPAVEEAWRRAVSIPIYPSLSPEEVDTVSEALKAVV
jgi:dTDP-4-amino-4,6-dideoxygalactose transaminase